MTGPSSLIEVAKQAVREAAQVTRAVQHRIGEGGATKSDASPVTVADFASQAVVGAVLHAADATTALLAEEDPGFLREREQAAFAARVQQEVDAVRPGTAVLATLEKVRTVEARAVYWILDPIDGTKGFVRGMHYAIALARIEAGNVVQAVLACPKVACGDDEGTLMWAIRGEGAWQAPLFSEGPAQRMHVTRGHSVHDLRFCESFEKAHSAHGHSAQAAARLGVRAEPVRLDSQAKYGLVARGDAEVYLRIPKQADYVEKAWDHAAGMLVVQEAGGHVTDLDGKPLDVSGGALLQHNRGILASDGAFHQAVLDAVAAVLK